MQQQSIIVAGLLLVSLFAVIVSAKSSGEEDTGCFGGKCLSMPWKGHKNNKSHDSSQTLKNMKNWFHAKTHKVADNTFWNGLRTTWSFTPNATYAFTATGRTIEEATAKGFKFHEDFCTDKMTRFRGIRYMIPGDPGIALLFDRHGIVAGIQTMVPKSLYTPPDTLINRPMIDDGDYWTMTAYFIDPSIICLSTKHARHLNTSGNGDRLLIQNSNDVVHPDSSKYRAERGRLPEAPMVRVPMTEKELNDSGIWVRGSCITAMGFHYFWNISQDMSPDEYFRVQLLVNQGKLLGFAFIVNTLLPSERYEQTSAAGSEAAIAPTVLNFFDTDQSVQLLNTLHVFFIDDPINQIVC